MMLKFSRIFRLDFNVLTFTMTTSSTITVDGDFILLASQSLKTILLSKSDYYWLSHGGDVHEIYLVSCPIRDVPVIGLATQIVQEHWSIEKIISSFPYLRTLSIYDEIEWNRNWRFLTRGPDRILSGIMPSNIGVWNFRPSPSQAY